MKNLKRDYQNKMEKEKNYDFELGNELGAEIERNKNMYEKEYQKNNNQRSNNQVSNQKPSSNNMR